MKLGSLRALVRSAVEHFNDELNNHRVFCDKGYNFDEPDLVDTVAAYLYVCGVRFVGDDDENDTSLQT
ncbi:MAG: hypothetical protein IIX13_09385 [Bacteroidales bacterium]|nr:hypothetical protein [Bacteroidales bacterium]